LKFGSGFGLGEARLVSTSTGRFDRLMKLLILLLLKPTPGLHTPSDLAFVSRTMMRAKSLARLITLYRSSAATCTASTFEFAPLVKLKEHRSSLQRQNFAFFETVEKYEGTE